MDEVGRFCGHQGIPDGVAEGWRRRGIRGWTALQRAAWEQGLPAGEDHWLICAPTSAGKGLLAEVVAARRLAAGEKVLWLVPTRALAESLAGQLRATLGAAGRRVICATGEQFADSDALMRGRFDLCVAVFEKALAWRIQQPHGLAEVGLVVADELSLLRDAERGGRLDLLLTLIKTGPYRARRLGLSLPIPNAAELAAWWEGRLLAVDGRPRPLREGILDATTGMFRWLERNAGEEVNEGEERIADGHTFCDWLERARDAVGAGDWGPAMAATFGVAAGLAVQGEPTLLFAPSRALARRWARGAAAVFELPAVDPLFRERAERLTAREPCHDHVLLAETLGRGAACHHADLSPSARELVAEAFDVGGLRLLIATPTLAQGLNLTARNVAQWPWRAAAPAEAGPRQIALERWRWIDQGGRAARLGRGRGPGRSILAAADPGHAARLWRRYLLEGCEPLTSALGRSDLECAVLAGLAGDVARSRENLRGLLGATFAAVGGWRGESGALEVEVNDAVSRCRTAHLLHPAGGEGDPLRLSGLGQVCAMHGLMPETVEALGPWLSGAFDPEARLEAPLPALWVLALAAPAGLWPLPRRPDRDPIGAQARRWFEENEREPPPLLDEVLYRAEGPTTREVAALAAGWRMAMWIGPESTQTIERRTGWTAGALARAGDGLARLAGGVAAAATLLGGPPERAEAWRVLAGRLRLGCGEGAVSLGALHVAGLGREAVRALSSDGLHTPAALAEAAPDLLGRILGDAELGRRVRVAAREAVGRNAEFEKPDAIESDPGRRFVAPEPCAASLARTHEDGEPDVSATEKLLELDLQSPGVVRAAGCDLRLTPLGFDLLATLAERPGKVVTREALYHRLWPEDGPEDQQLDAHRRRLARALAQGLSHALGARAAGLIEVVRGIGFRLNLAPDQIALRRA